MAGGAVSVHELRYALAYGMHSDEALAAQGHSYLRPLVPLLAGLLVCAFADLLLRWARATPNSEHAPSGVSLARLWAGASATLIATYAAQEWVEGMLAPGHPSGLEAIVGHGGWMAVPLAVAIGAAIALALRGPRALAPPVIAVPFPALPSAARARVALQWQPPSPKPLARFLAARGPPPSVVL